MKVTNLKGDAPFDSLLKIAEAPGFEAAANLSNDDSIRFTALIHGDRKPADFVESVSKVPAPDDWSVWWPWALAWLIAASVATYGLTLWYWLEEEIWYCSGFPWRKVGGILYAPLISPALLPLLFVHGCALLFIKDWTGFGKRCSTRLFRLGLRVGIVRRLPSPPNPTAAPAVTLAPRAGARLMLAAVVEEPDADEVDWYVVERTLALGWMAALKAADVELFDFELRVPTAMKGFAVHATKIDAFEEILGISHLEAELFDTDIARTSFARYPLPAPIVEPTGFDRESTAFIRRVLDPVSASMDIGLRIEYGGGRPQKPMNAIAPQRVRIWYAAFPDGANGTASAPQRCFGNAQSGERITFYETDTRFGPVCCDADGNAVVQCVRGEIFLTFKGLFDHHADAWAAEALARAVREGIRLLRKGRTAKDDCAEQDRWREEREGQRAAYIQACMKRLGDRREELQKGIKVAEELVVEAGRSISLGLADKAKLVKEMKAFESSLETEGELIGKEFDQLSESPYVTGLEWQGSALDVYTRTVFIKHLGTTYRIGRFRIRLKTEGRISLFSLDRHLAPSTTFHHPHVRDNEAPCFGNIHESLSKTMARREYAQVVYLLFRFLESYNHHGGVERIECWPEATDDAR
jgi:hypothetical protein